MKKILSLFAVALLLMGITMNASADVTGMDVSYEKKGTQLVATVTADGTLGAAVVEIKFDTDELSCSKDDVSIKPSDDYVIYEYNVTGDAICIGFVATDAAKVPKGEIATITFDIASGAQGKLASQFDIKFNEKDIVTLDELKKLTGTSDGQKPSGNGGNGSTGSTEETEKVETEVIVLETVTIGDGTVTVKQQKEVEGIGAQIEEIETAIESILTPEQLERVKAGAKVEILLDVQQKNVEIPVEDKECVEDEVLAQAEKKPNLKVGVYLDINLLVGFEGETAEKVSETSKVIKITIDIPDELKELGETFYVVRVHEGEATFLEDLDDNKNTITFETDKFSTYAVVYEAEADVEDTGDVEDDENVTPDEPQDEETPEKEKNNTVVFIIIGAVVVVAAGAGVAYWFISKKR